MRRAGERRTAAMRLPARPSSASTPRVAASAGIALAYLAPDTAAPTAGRAAPSWDTDGTVHFYGGPLSNFAPTPGLRLPFGYHGHHENDRVSVRTVEHWFQACKATSRQQFDLILACGAAAAAKRAGRETELRPDWEQVKLEIMLCALRGKFALESYRSGLLLTHPRPLAEDSPTDSSGAPGTSTAATAARTCWGWR